MRLLTLAVASALALTVIVLPPGSVAPAVPLAPRSLAVDMLDFEERAAGTFVVETGAGVVTLDAAGARIASDSGAAALLLPAPSGELVGVDTRSYVVHRYQGNDPTQWVSNVPVHARVLHRDAAPGIDVLWRSSTDGALEFDALVAPGADPSAMRLRVEGAVPIVRADGALALGDVVFAAPFAFQGADPVESSWRVEGGSVSFSVGEYDASRPLVIDPVLVGSTYSGEQWADKNHADVVAGPGGHLYIAGEDWNSFGWRSNVVLNKYSPDAKTHLWRLYYGGDQIERAIALRVTAAGDIFVGGETESADLPTTPGVVQPAAPLLSSGNAFLARFNESGGLRAATYLAGNSHDSVESIDVLPDGSLVLAGYTLSTSFLVPPTAFQPTLDPDRPLNSTWPDAYGLRMTPDLATVTGGTYFGGDRNDYGWGIVAMPDGDVVLTGEVNSDVPLLSPFDATRRSSEGFAARFSGDMSTLRWSSYFGGSSGESPHNDAVLGPDGRIYVTGMTSSRSDFPFVRPIDSTYDDWFDAFVLVFEPSDPPSVFFSTYLGAERMDVGKRIAVADGLIYLVGSTESQGFPLRSAIDGSLESGGSDAFLTVIDPLASEIVSSTYLGGSRGDWGSGILYRDGDVFLTGASSSDDLPGRGPPQSTRHPGSAGATYEDLFLARVNMLGAPSALSGLGTLPGRVALAWDAPTETGGAPITHYNVYRALGGEDERRIAQVAVPGYEDDWVLDGQGDPPTEASYRVTAVTVKAESAAARLDCRLSLVEVPSLIACSNPG